MKVHFACSPAPRPVAPRPITRCWASTARTVHSPCPVRPRFLAPTGSDRSTATTATSRPSGAPTSMCFPELRRASFLRYTDARTGLVNFNVAEGFLDPDAYSRDRLLSREGRVGARPAERPRLSRFNLVRQQQSSAPVTTATSPTMLESLSSSLAFRPTSSPPIAQAEYFWRELALSTARAGVQGKLGARVYSLQTRR